MKFGLGWTLYGEINYLSSRADWVGGGKKYKDKKKNDDLKF